ncbi:MAG: hypothetical protein WC947_10560 [Elusimicrobiota bacterium]
MRIIRFLLFIVSIGFVICSCNNKMKQPAADAISQAEKDIASLKKENLSLYTAELLLDDAHTMFGFGDYVKSKSTAEKASAEAKSLLSKSKK